MKDSKGGLCILSDARLALDQYHLNEVAGAIWNLCDGTHTLDEMARRVAALCPRDAPPHRVVLADVARLLASLRAERLVTWTDEATLDVLLVVPPAPTVYAKQAIDTPEYSAPPLGLCYIAAVLRDHGFKVGILDLHQQAGNPEDVVTACRKHDPAIVGVTASTPTFPNARAIGRFVKAWRKDCATIVGGPHATGASLECASCGAFDFVCVGEGERTMLNLTTALLRRDRRPNAVSGLCFADSHGRAVRTPPQPRVARLDTLPLPARDLLDLDTYHQRGSLVTSRGCPVGCNFCACTAIAGRSYRTHSIRRVLDEIDGIVRRYGYRHFDFHDDTFNLHADRVLEFCRGLKTRSLKAQWGCFCRAAQMTPRLAEQMAQAGCKVIQFGVESGNNQVLQSLHKNTTATQIEAAVRAAAQAGVDQIVCGFIIGHPSDTVQSVRDTIDFGLKLRDLGATRLTLSLLTPYPGTPVYEHRSELGITLLTNDWEQYTFSRVVMQTPNLKRESLRELYADGLRTFLAATHR